MPCDHVLDLELPLEYLIEDDSKEFVGGRGLIVVRAV